MVTLSPAVMTLFAILMVVGTPACQWNVGTVDVQLVHTSAEGYNPLDPDLIKKVRVSIKGDGLALRRYQFDLKVGGSGTFEDIPVGASRVLIVEGLDVSGYVRSRGISSPFELKEGINRIYLFISRVGEFSAPPAVTESGWSEHYRARMRSARAFHTATLLTDNQVLVAGGIALPDQTDYLARVTSGALRTAELYDPTAGAFALSPNSADCQQGETLCLLAGRAHHSASVLPARSDVLFVGGEPPVNLSSGTTMAEYFEYAKNLFSVAPSPVNPRSRSASCTVTASQDLLFAGGDDAAFLPTDSIELFRADTGAFSEVAKLSVARSGAAAVAYPGGVLVIGGWEPDESVGPTALKASARVDRLELGSGAPTLSQFQLLEARAEHAAVVIVDDDEQPWVFVCGGLSDAITAIKSCELLEPVAGTSALSCPMDEPRWKHTISVLQTGWVLIAGGFQSGRQSAALNTAVLMNPPGNCYRQQLTMISKRAGHTATVLNNGMVVLVGGISNSLQMASEDYEIFNP